MTPTSDVLFLACDVETTGLDATKDKLLSVAAIMLDSNLNELDEGINLIIQRSEYEVELLKRKTDPFVINMHETSGLWQQITQATTSDVDVQMQLHDYISQYLDPLVSLSNPGNRRVRMLGNSVKLDYEFITRQLPLITELINYRVVDVSSIAMLAELWCDVPRYVKAGTHVAMTDIRECIAELKYLRSMGLFPHPQGVRILASTMRLAQGASYQPFKLMTDEDREYWNRCVRDTLATGEED